MGQFIENKKLEVPYYPSDKDTCKYQVLSWEEKTIADYLKINVFDVNELNIIDYWFFLRESVIYSLSQTAEGIDYLNNAYRLTETEPDREALREKYGK